jgi:hypothetical protein
MNHCRHCRADEAEPKLTITEAPRVLETDQHLRVALAMPDGGSKIVDLTEPITRAIAHEIWRHTGGNGVVNWLQAEIIFENLAKLAEPHAEPLRLAA